MGDAQEYGDVVQEIRGALNPGRLKLQSGEVLFKNMKTGKVDQFPKEDIEKAQWLKRAKGYCLKFVLGSGHIHRYDGFKAAEFDKLDKYITSNYTMGLEKVDMSLKGWNWGTTEFEANALNFKVDSCMAFEIPLTNVMNATTAKNEVTVEFHPNDDAAVSLMEVRFHIPPVTDPENDTDPVAEFHKNVMAKADIIQISGDSICTLQEVQCLTPRGRYDLKLYPTFLQLHGKTFDYKIPFQTILRLFLLPHKDGRQMYFVVSLDPPIKQGQTRYHFLILLFIKEDEMTLEMAIEEDEIKEKYEGKLEKEMTGLEFEVVSKVFKAITGKKITVPGNYLSHHNAHAVSCSYKASTGLLYPLERGFIFVHKPPLHIRFEEVSHVNFARSSGSNRSFDFEVETKTGGNFTFIGVEKDEYNKLYDFVKNKKLRVKNLGDKGGKVSYNEMDGSDDEGGDHDAYMERMKAEGKDRDDDSFDDSTDEDFDPGESGSSVAEEYDSNPPTTSDEDSDSDYSDGSNDGSGSDAERKREERAQKKAAKEAKKQEKREKREKEKEADEKRKAERKEKKPKGEKKLKAEGGASRKRKNKKDPNAPKRPMSGYFLWLNENREQIKEDNPGIAVTEISKKAGELWRALSDKSEWEEKAKQAKEDYLKAMEEYNKNKPDTEDESEEEKPSAKKSKSKPKGSPKKKASGTSMAGGSYKSKEYLSSLSSSNDSDEDDKPLAKKKEKKEESGSEKEASSAGSDEEKKSEKEKSASESEKEESGSEKAASGSEKAASGSEKEESEAEKGSGSGSD